MKKTILAISLDFIAIPALANHPVARATAVASSDHPVEAAAVTSH
ncbi:hypothetical protein [Klebsiella aerogenes]